ncbi:MAG: TasA family protein [Coriobacteriia bacterium]
MRRYILIVLAIGLAAGIGSAGAYFTGQAEVPDNIIKAGAVSVSTEPTSAAISIDSLSPGGVAERSMTLLNDGSLPSSVVVTGAKKAGITDFYNALTCRVTCAGTSIYDGPLNLLHTTPLVLAPGASSRLSFAIGLPATAGNDLAGDYVKLTLYFDAEQVH